MKSSDSCASYSFEISSSDTTIAIADLAIEIEQDSFFEGVCVFTGTIEKSSLLPLAANGTYMCSNFDEGTWSSEHVALTGEDSFLAVLDVNVPARGCEYSVTYTGFK